MAWKHSLLQARSYIAVILGFLLAFSVVVYVEMKMPPAPAESAELTLSADFPTLPAPRALTFDEAVWARIAWQYFVNNTQSSGLANAIDNQPYTTMWDTGSYLMATISAQRLGIITQDELNARVNAVLTALSSLPLADGQLPSLYYHTQRPIRLNSLSQNESQSDWSAVDLSRLTMALNIVAWLYPEQTGAIARLIAPWQFDALFMQQEQRQPLNFRAVKKWLLVTQSNRDSYGYQLYAAHGLRRVSPLAGIVLGTQPPSARTISIDGLRIPYDSLAKIGKVDHPVVTTMPYLLTGLEVGFDIRSAEISWRVMKVQESRYRSRGGDAYVNTDNEEQLPRFIDDAVISRFPAQIDKSRAEIKEAALQLSTKSAFGWYALFRTSWSDEMRQRAGVLFEPGRGWYDGIIAANGQQSRVIGANTNALVLESLVYIAQGPLFCQNCASAPAANLADDQRP
ncbi:DUF3131 domain-containing protein [Serratia ureilytica]|uniref:DUF3131 domain-containing protein n=1 Tax=Serratia ureilytica TaxID=300181 RepID=UPI0018D8AD02|nr:DUF3131 domain-containing protein [Serratia ureilytica]MBH3106963.1 DUF3131 domain-containing protein [Serratia ureilytica]